VFSDEPKKAKRRRAALGHLKVCGVCRVPIVPPPGFMCAACWKSWDKKIADRRVLHMDSIVWAAGRAREAEKA